MHVKFADINSQYIELKPEIDAAIQRVLDKGDFILGDAVLQFEKEFAEYCGAKYCVGVSSGLSALELSLRAVGVDEGDTVILPANTFIATALAVTNIGAKIKLVDCYEDTFLMDNEMWQKVVKENKNRNLRCTIAVDLFGQVDIDSIITSEKNVSIPYISDSCQSHGSKYKDKNAGSVNRILSAFSFYPAKNLGGIMDGGAICIGNYRAEEYYDRLLELRNYGSKKKYHHNTIGTNSRLSTINAAVLSIKLKHLDNWNHKRNSVSALYKALLCEVPQIKLPVVGEDHYSNYHLYVIRAVARNGLQQYLKDHGIETGIHYPIPIHKSRAFEGYDFGSKNSFPVTEKLCDEILSLPMHPFLTQDEIIYVCEKIKEFYK